MERYEIKYKEKFMAEQEIINLKEWFKSNYTYQEQKYRRLHFLGLTDDDGVAGKDKLSELYAEAETKRKRIQELEEAIAGFNQNNSISNEINNTPSSDEVEE